jgi:hypothetical protein
MRSKPSASRKRRPADLKGRSFAFFGAFSYWPSYHPGPPDQLARRLGASIRNTVDDQLDYLVLGDRRGAGRAEAKKKGERLVTQQQAGKKGRRRLSILDEAAFREMVRMDINGKCFAFYGGFDCCPEGFDDGLLSRMVEAVGGKVQQDVDEKLDYLVLGNRRGPGKIAARNRAETLQAAGSMVQVLTEEGFLELVRSEQPTKAASMDFTGFITQLHGTVDQGKLGRALKMLKAESFKLYTHLDENRLVGVVRSQTGVGSVYAPWLTPDGLYGCSTPELEDCMGLQGSVCKHLLVLLVGLARLGEMEPATAFAWVKAAQTKRPRSDQELAAETFLQYKAAEAGEIDWRPTETIPEDFYAY